MSERTLFADASLLDPEADAPERASLLVEGGRIAARLRPDEPGPADAYRLDLAGAGLGPGLIDLHFHGDLGLRPAHDAGPSLAAASASMARHGVTAFLPTTFAWSPGELAARLDALAAALDRGRWPGAVPIAVHLEGPWIRPEAAGAQPAAAIRSFDVDEGRDVLARGAGAIRMVTLAPETPGADDLLAELARRGVCACLGHTLASSREIARAAAAGARHVTHLFNAMGSRLHRESAGDREPEGVAGAVLADDRLSCDVIADGAHVHPDWLGRAARAKRGRLALITDRIELARGASSFGSGALTAAGGAWRLPNGRLAGSHLALHDAIRNVVGWRVMARHEALAAATLVPARLLGLEAERGTLRPGARADLVLWGEGGDVHATWVGGRLVHGRVPG